MQQMLSIFYQWLHNEKVSYYNDMHIQLQRVMTIKDHTSWGNIALTLLGVARH